MHQLLQHAAPAMSLLSGFLPLSHATGVWAHVPRKEGRLGGPHCTCAVGWEGPSASMYFSHTGQVGWWWKDWTSSGKRHCHSAPPLHFGTSGQDSLAEFWGGMEKKLKRKSKTAAARAYFFYCSKGSKTLEFKHHVIHVAGTTATDRVFLKLMARRHQFTRLSCHGRQAHCVRLHCCYRRPHAYTGPHS